MTVVEPAVLAVDWGNSGIRGWVMDRNGGLLETIEHPLALKDVKDGVFASALEASFHTVLRSWPNLPIILCGMAGARGMWVEAPYVQTPVTLTGAIEQAIPVTVGGHPGVILAGAIHESSDGFDVMRGEETQILGAAALVGYDAATICIPGTHAKWARLRDQTLVSFATWITGELFQMLRNSMVGRLAEGDDFSRETFLEGLERARKSPINRAAFSARADALAGRLPASGVSSYLSGLTIGSEIAGATVGLRSDPVLLLAKGQLADRYGTAFDHFGVRHRLVDALEAKRTGLALAARMLWPSNRLVEPK